MCYIRREGKRMRREKREVEGRVPVITYSEYARCGHRNSGSSAFGPEVRKAYGARGPPFHPLKYRCTDGSRVVGKNSRIAFRFSLVKFPSDHDRSPNIVKLGNAMNKGVPVDCTHLDDRQQVLINNPSGFSSSLLDYALPISKREDR